MSDMNLLAKAITKVNRLLSQKQEKFEEPDQNAYKQILPLVGVDPNKPYEEKTIIDYLTKACARLLATKQEKSSTFTKIYNKNSSTSIADGAFSITIKDNLVVINGIIKLKFDFKRAATLLVIDKRFKPTNRVVIPFNTNTDEKVGALIIKPNENTLIFDTSHKANTWIRFNTSYFI